MDKIVIIHIILYAFIVILGFTISITVGTNRSKIKNLCILYADFTKSDKQDVDFIVHSSSMANCNLPIYFSVIAFILYGLAAGASNVLILLKKCNPDRGSSFMCVMPFIAINVLIAFVTFIMACMISVGFKQFCGHIEKQYSGSSCSVIEDHSWLIGVDNDHTYISWTVAETSAWVAFLLWVIQVGLSVFEFIHSNRQSRTKHTATPSTTTTNSADVLEHTAHPV